MELYFLGPDNVVISSNTDAQLPQSTEGYTYIEHQLQNSAFRVVCRINDAKVAEDFTFFQTSSLLTAGVMVLLLIAVVGVYADFQVNGKMTFITIVAVIAVLGAFVLPELTARRFIKKDKSFIGHTMRYVFNDNGINVLDEQNGTTALHAWGNIMNMYETAGYFFMFLGKQSALLIPKRCLSDEDLADFREMLQFQLGSRYENRTQKSKKAK